MTREVPWLRVLVEGVVIVASILLAFAIDASWDRRVAQRFEVELLTNLFESVEASEQALNRALDRLSVDEARTARFYNLTASELASFPQDSVNGLSTALIRSSATQVLEGPLSGVQNTAQLGLIRDPQVRLALNQWLALATQLEGWNQRTTALGEAGLAQLGRHDVFRDFWINGSDGLPQNVDMNAVRRDDEVMSVAGALARTRRVWRQFAELLLGSLDELRQLLEPLVEERS